MCILILNINGPIRAKILHNKRNKRVLQQWGACDVQQIKSERLMTGYAFQQEGEKNSGAEKSGVSGPGPECPENPDTPEKVRTLRASAQQQKNRQHTVFQSSISCP
jgi:hypothetical protein